MIQLNFLKIIFAQFTLIILVLSGLINAIEKYLPVFLVRSFRYGKFAYRGQTKGFIKPIEVPKAWFKHFYINASLLMSITMYIATNTFIFKKSPPNFLIEVLNTLAGTNRYSTVSSTATYLALVLFALQCYRRFYDTQFVSVFGQNSRMNLLHYFIGIIHYTAIPFTILVEAPHFVNISQDEQDYFKLSDISYLDIIASAVFLWAWWHQHKATKILGNLRKNPKGKIISGKHYLPEGDLFKYIASPHISMEIVMYMCLTVILWQNSTWWYVFIWVITNQVETALLTQWWYQQTFPNYPSTRKALIPFIL